MLGIPKGLRGDFGGEPLWVEADLAGDDDRRAVLGPRRNADDRAAVRENLDLRRRLGVAGEFVKPLRQLGRHRWPPRYGLVTWRRFVDPAPIQVSKGSERGIERGG